MEFIEEFDTAISLWSKGEIDKFINKCSNDKIYELVETLSLIAKYHFTPTIKPNENFSFVANSSLSGGSHPCSNHICRREKMSQLITFSSLYADDVYIQNPFENIKIKGPENIHKSDCLELSYGISNYFYLKPFIEAGIIKYAQNEVNLCEIHNESIAKPLANRIEKKEKQLYDIIHKQLLESCSVSLNIGKNVGHFLEIKGPSNILDHGIRYFHLFKPLPPFLSRLLKKKLPYKFTKSDILDSGVFELIINPVLRDLSKQEWHSEFYGTSYLCDNETQMKMASELNSAAYTASSSAFNQGMQHYLPTVYSKDPQAILQLRKNEGEAFKVYRDKFNR